MTQTVKAGFKRRRRAPKKKPVITRKVCDWSEYQRALFNDVECGDGNTVVDSAPGSGKTTSTAESLFHLPEEFRVDDRTLMTSFSKLTVTEFESRIPAGISKQTSHRLGFRTVSKHWGPVYGIGGPKSVDKDCDSLFALVTDRVGTSPDLNNLRQNLVKAIVMSKTMLADTHEQIADVLCMDGISHCGLRSDNFVEVVYDIMEKTRLEPSILYSRSVIPFVDMIWLPHANGWMPEQFDRVFIDEAQDMSAARTELVLNAVKQGGRVCAVGDAKQAIFGFAGAGKDALDVLARTLDAKRMPLSVSYRCAKQIIELAKKINPAIEAADNAPDGTVEYMDAESLLYGITPGSAVLSRNNFTLIKAAFALLARGFKVNIKGKDIGDRFLWRIGKCWQPDTVEDLQRDIEDWSEELCTRLEEKRYSTTSVEDEARSLMSFTEGAANVGEVCRRIDEFFTDDTEKSQIVLSTAHKFKGLERDKVYLLNKTFHPERGGEEENVYYVALTRAKNHLVFANGSLRMAA